MIIKKIILKDFFRYYGEQVIDCTINQEKNVIVIIGENGRGKTTLLSAFNWVFYDEIIKPLKLDNILNYRKRNEMEIGDNAEASVTIFFEEGGIEYKIVSTLIFNKVNNNTVNLINKKTQKNIFKIESNGNETELNYNIATEKLLIPKDLRGFFFFDGEHISRLAKVDGKKEIKNAILNVLGISYLYNAKDHLTFIKKSLMQELKIYKLKNTNQNDIEWDHNKVEKEIEQIEKEIKNINDKLDVSRGTLEDLNNIIGTSDITAVKELEDKNNKITNKLKEYKQKLVETERDIKKHIGTSFKYYLMYNYINDVEQLLELKRKEGRLPSNIKYTFIEDLIEKGICICGTCLKDGTKEYESILKLKEQAGSQELDDAYYNLKNLINIIKKEHNDFYIKLNSMTLNREKIKENIYNFNEELKIINKKLDNTDSDNIKEASKTRGILKIEIDELIKKLGVLENSLEQKVKEKDELEKKLILSIKNNKEIEKTKRKIEITEKLLNANNDFTKMFAEMVRQELDLKIKDVFSKITNKDYRVAILTKDFELKIVSKLNEYDLEDYDKREEVLSTGEEQITSLSFIGALVSYAKDNKDNIILSKLTGEDYPIVMDSPFGNLDEIHTINVAANIGKLAPQVIIVVSNKQWEGYVESNIKDQVIRTYKISDGEKIHGIGEYTQIRKVD
ncbi:MAG: AAA family ATPase [Clostridium sp.]|uniref:AAA family ATPase n=1 Tax=Clostridium sp. TaxID=1506 RepID=UPI002A9089C0|nr:AAA family ATPase [Clostridium sp.]MDY6228882.1 AAA family ATPase [Clostridium sp.]